MMLHSLTRQARVASATVALALLSAPASAQSAWYANLNSAQEVGAPNGSLGTGYAFVSLSGNLLSIQITFTGLTGLSQASHIHCCVAPGVNGAVATQVPSFTGFPTGVTSGSYSNTFDLTLATSYNPTFITNNGGTVGSAMAVLLTGLNTGNTYVNIHTNINPGGEIRGQLIATPEPSTVVLLTAGLAGMMAVAARKRRA